DELDPSVGAGREIDAAHRRVRRAERREVLLAGDVDLDRSLEAFARRDAERDLLAELQLEAIAHRQRPRELDAPELRTVAALEVAHDDGRALARDPEVLPAHRVRGH